MYAERRVLEKYHRETTGDQDATVSEWRDSEEGNKQQRTVKYQVPLAVPVAIKKLIGMLLMISQSSWKCSRIASEPDMHVGHKHALAEHLPLVSAWLLDMHTTINILSEFVCKWASPMPLQVYHLPSDVGTHKQQPDNCWKRSIQWVQQAA